MIAILKNAITLFWVALISANSQGVESQPIQFDIISMGIAYREPSTEIHSQPDQIPESSDSDTLNITLLKSEPDKAEINECDYIDRTFCIPGWITNESWYRPAPDHIIGKAVWYNPGLMRATAEWRGMSLKGFRGGVSMFAVEDIGEVIWIKRPGNKWEGPFLVVDASQRNHMWATVTGVKESVEVDFETARRWGMIRGDYESFSVNQWMIRDVEVYKGLRPPNNNSEPIIYSEWFKNNATFENRQTPNPLWFGDYMKYTNYQDYEIDLIIAYFPFIDKFPSTK